MKMKVALHGKLTIGAAILVLFAASITAQEAIITPPESIAADSVPKIPASVAETAGRYGSYRSASLADWNPAKREMLIATRFGDTPQLHLVSAPGGERLQLTFYPDAVTNGRFHPNGGDYIVFSKDVGGGEWYQLYRYDLKTGDVTLLTDGKARNLMGPWSSKGDQLAYMSTRRTGKDTDLWVMNPADPKTDHLLTKLEGGGWEPLDWSPDDKWILLKEELSINEAYLWLVDTGTGEKTALTPRDSKEKVSYGDGEFSKDGKGVYVTTDKASEFHRLAYVALATKQPKYLTSNIPWDVETPQISHDGRHLAFVTNEAGVSVVHVRKANFEKDETLPQLPVGVVGVIRWHENGHDLGFTVTNARGPGDAYSIDINTGKIERWTNSETAVKTDAFPQAELVKWKTFDGKEISGFLYRPPAAKFPGRRPVLVVIHGGPEGQSQPIFLGRSNYYLNELGMSNLVTFLEHTEACRRDLRRVEYGDERNPKMHDFLEKIAPMNNIEKIKKPMMVVAGKNDPRVPVSESEQIVAALKKQGTPVWYLMGKDEGHGFRKKTNQDFQFYATVEFLQEYLLK